MPVDRPLNVDSNLPLPEAGQASTVFSLTALFGAYFAIYLVLGIPALVGLASGTVLALFLVRDWIQGGKPRSFEGFLTTALTDNGTTSPAFAVTVSAAQCGFAASELLILREIARISLGLRSDHATLVAVGLGIIGYFYVLFGGYLAVYRTDVLQFALVTGMAAIFAIHIFQHPPSAGWQRSLLPRYGYWEPPFSLGGLKYVYQFAIGAIMGVGLLTAAPDAWKRVFVVATLRKRTLARYLLFVAVGVAPFAILVPLAATTPPIPDGRVRAGQLFAGLLSTNVLFIAAALGLIASFLSAFDSAILAAVHVGLIQHRKRHPAGPELARFHWSMVVALLVSFLLFLGLLSVGNPYLLANLLLGGYAIIAGIQVGTRGKPSSLPAGLPVWIIIVGFVGWIMYFTGTLDLPNTPTTYQINTVPGGAFIFLITALICALVGKRLNRHVRSQAI